MGSSSDRSPQRRWARWRRRGVQRSQRRRCPRSTSARCSFGGRSGRATTAAASRRKTTTTTPTRKRGRTRAIMWRLRSADFGRGFLAGGRQWRRRWRQVGTTSTKKTSCRGQGSRRSARAVHRASRPLSPPAAAGQRGSPRVVVVVVIVQRRFSVGCGEDDGNDGMGDTFVTTTTTTTYNVETCTIAQQYNI